MALGQLVQFHSPQLVAHLPLEEWHQPFSLQLLELLLWQLLLLVFQILPLLDLLLISFKQELHMDQQED